MIHRRLFSRGLGWAASLLPAPTAPALAVAIASLPVLGAAPAADAAAGGTPSDVAAAAANVPRAVREALAQAGQNPEARVEVATYRASLAADCVVQEVEPPEPIARSGNVALRLWGEGAGGEACEGTALVRVRVRTPVWIATEALAPGTPLAGRVREAFRDVGAREALHEIPPGAIARHRLAAGAFVERRQMTFPGLETGSPVRVVLRSGGLTVAQRGVIATCGPDAVCARLPSGKRVEGAFTPANHAAGAHGLGTLEVMLP